MGNAGTCSCGVACPWLIKHFVDADAEFIEMKKTFLVVIAIVLIDALITGGCESPTSTPTPQPLPEIASPAYTPEITQAPSGQRRDGQNLRIPELTPAPTSIPPAPPAPTPVPPAISWSNRASLLEPNSEFAVAELDGKIYVIGGYPSTRITVTTVQVYSSSEDRWELITPLPQPINHGMAAATNGKVYIIGGQTTASGNLGEAGYLDTVFEYDPNTAIWTRRASMPTKRSAGAAVVIGDKIYVAGGRPPRGNDFAVYDTRENRWAVLPDLPTQRNHIIAAAIDGKIYVVGGRFGGGFNSEVTDVLEVYDPATNMWTTRAPMPTARGGINGIAVNGCFYVWGGEGNQNHPSGLFEQVEVYNSSTDTWRRLDPMPVVVHGVTGAAFINGWVHLPGGGTSQGGSSGSTIHQVFRPEMPCR